MSKMTEKTRYNYKNKTKPKSKQKGLPQKVI